LDQDRDAKVSKAKNSNLDSKDGKAKQIGSLHSTDFREYEALLASG